MKKNQIIAIIGSLVIGLGVGFGVADTTHHKDLESIRAIALKQNSDLIAQIKELTFKDLVGVKGEVTTDRDREDGNQIFELTDGSWYIINLTEQKFIFQPVELGDWDYQVNSMEELQKIVSTYISMKNTGTW